MCNYLVECNKTMRKMGKKLIEKINIKKWTEKKNLNYDYDFDLELDSDVKIIIFSMNLVEMNGKLLSGFSIFWRRIFFQRSNLIFF